MRNIMNTNDAIKTLLKIAQSQQKMIERLAQALPLKSQTFEPGKPELRPADVVLNALPPSIHSMVENIEEKLEGMDHFLDIRFKPGKASQAALDYIVRVVQQLTKANKLSFPYTVRAV